MPILTFLIVAAILGLVVWLLVTYIPMPQPIRAVIVVVAVLFLLLWLLQGVGVIGALNQPMRIH